MMDDGAVKQIHGEADGVRTAERSGCDGVV